METTQVTPQMRHAVRVEECLLTGHSYDVQTALGRGPTHVVCTNCGEVWAVEPKPLSGTLRLSGLGRFHLGG